VTRLRADEVIVDESLELPAGGSDSLARVR